jgi:catalase (peroxidase I)
MLSKVILAAVSARGVLAGHQEFDAVANIEKGTPIASSAPIPSREDYEKALKDLDMDAVKSDMKALLADDKDFWPADWGSYIGLMARLTWHCSGSYRASDGVGGCGGGRQRFDPERSWPDNTNLDKARALVAPLKDKYGDALSWGDLFILAGTTALRESGAPLRKMCFGRVDDKDGEKSMLLGPTALQYEQMPCVKNGACKPPLGDTTLGLVYVNPEGPMANPDPAASSKDIRQTFQIMGHSDKNTVALIGGGHAVGKGHGACPAGAGMLPVDAYKVGQLPWQGLCGTGKGNDTVTAGFEGAWTSKPLQWDNEYFQKLLSEDWEKFKGPGGHWQWRIKGSDSQLMRLTSDVALLHDGAYLKYVKEFAEDMGAFNAAFEDAWFDLTTTYGSGTWADNAKCDDGEFPESLRNVQKKDVSKYLTMLNDDFLAAASPSSENTSVFVSGAVCGMIFTSLLAFVLVRRTSSQTHYNLIEE